MAKKKVLKISSTKNKMGRPTKMTDEKIRQLKAICRLKPRLEDCAAFLDLEKSTIEKWIKKTHGITFSEFRDQNMVHTRFMIIREIINQCQKGNTAMLIYASKNLCGWKDAYKSENTNKNIEIVISKEDEKLA